MGDYFGGKKTGPETQKLPFFTMIDKNFNELTWSDPKRIDPKRIVAKRIAGLEW